MPQRVLVIEDDAVLARLVADALAPDGFQVACEADAQAALTRAESFIPDFVLLDLTPAHADRFEVCRKLATGARPPAVIVLAPRGRTDDVLHCIDLGADDYVTKPFDLQELRSRIRAVRRRHESPLRPVKLGKVFLDFERHRAVRNGAPLPLSRLEMQVLHYLAERARKAVTRDQLLQAVWGYREAPATRAVDISIARLRRKIEPDPHHPRFLLTLHGDGYCLNPCLRQPTPAELDVAP
jgi:two-component system response regulator MtrA